MYACFENISNNNDNISKVTSLTPWKRVNIKVLSLKTDKQAIHYNDDERIYEKNIIEYKNKILNKNNEFLK